MINNTCDLNMKKLIDFHGEKNIFFPSFSSPFVTDKMAFTCGLPLFSFSVVMFLSSFLSLIISPSLLCSTICFILDFLVAAAEQLLIKFNRGRWPAAILVGLSYRKHSILFALGLGARLSEN